MSKGIVLISGVNGYIAAVTAAKFLEAGFSVRGTVRKAASGKPVLEAFSKFVDNGTFEIVEVPDISVDGAFDEAVKGIVAIAHLASPVSLHFTDPEPVLRAAIHGTRTILASAQKYAGPQLKSFVLASSFAAVSNGYPAPYVYTEKDWNTTSVKEVEEQGKDASGPSIYRASKAAAETALWDFVKEKKPNFAVTAINPTFVLGPPAVLPESLSKANETLMPIATILEGNPIPPNWVSPVQGFVDVRDVGRLFVFAVEHPEKTNGERFLAATGVFANQAIADVLRKAYPNQKIAEGTPGEGYPLNFEAPQEGIKIDGSKSIKYTGQEYIGFERMVLDAAEVLATLL